MQLIKDYIVLDFLEWLKSKENKLLFIDRLDYDLKYKQKIEEYAKMYISSVKKINSGSQLIHPEVQLKTILKSFIDSTEFDKFFGYEYMHYGENIEEIMDRFCGKITGNFKNALLCYYWKAYGYSEGELDYKSLIKSIRQYNDYFDDFRGKAYCKSEVETIKQFLDYLDEMNVRVNVKTIPRTYLKRLVHKYNKTELEDEVIVDTLKERINQKMLLVLKQGISDSKLLRYKELGYLYDRYNDNSIKYKCLILPLKGELNLEKFVNKYWDDLDADSKDHLDIFVSKNDIQLSGYKSLEKISNFASLEDVVIPSVLIWTEQMKDARFINIRGLDFSQLYTCLQNIINMIKEGRGIENIVNKINAFVEECVEGNKQHIIIQQHINDNNGIIIGMQTKDVDFEYLYLSEIQIAMNELELINIEGSLKRRAVGILHNLKDAIRKRNITDLQICKEQFYKYIVCDAGKLVIETLKKYFYISLCLGIDEDVHEKS